MLRGCERGLVKFLTIETMFAKRYQPPGLSTRHPSESQAAGAAQCGIEPESDTSWDSATGTMFG